MLQYCKKRFAEHWITHLKGFNAQKDILSLHTEIIKCSIYMNTQIYLNEYISCLYFSYVQQYTVVHHHKHAKIQPDNALLQSLNLKKESTTELKRHRWWVVLTDTPTNMLQGISPKCKMRSKFWWFTGFCNSHYVSHFAAFFIVVGAKTSAGKSCMAFSLLSKPEVRSLLQEQSLAVFRRSAFAGSSVLFYELACGWLGTEPTAYPL